MRPSDIPINRVMSTRTMPRAADREAMLRMQGAFGLAIAAVIGAPFLALTIEVGTTSAPVWLPVVIVIATGIYAIFAVFFQRIRPVAPGNLRKYARVAWRRFGFSVIPAVVGLVLFTATGHWVAALVGMLLAVPGLVFAAPNQDDYLRHQEIWVERLPLPAQQVWGTASRDETPPWEDPDGGHGHGIGHHGLH